MTQILPDKYYQFIANYPFKWRYYKGPYDSHKEAWEAKQLTATNSDRTVMKGSEYLAMREKYERTKI